MKRTVLAPLGFTLATLLLIVNICLMLTRPAHSAPPPPPVEYKVLTLKMMIKDIPAQSNLPEESAHSDRIEKGLNKLGKEGWHLLWIQGDYYTFTK